MKLIELPQPDFGHTGGIYFYRTSSEADKTEFVYFVIDNFLYTTHLSRMAAKNAFSTT